MDRDELLRHAITLVLCLRPMFEQPLDDTEDTALEEIDRFIDQAPPELVSACMAALADGEAPALVN